MNIDLVDRFRAHIQARGLIPPGSRVLVGYSGGADSTCLLHLLPTVGVDAVAGHLHHGQREEAETELKLGEAFATELGVPFVSGRADVPRMARELKIGIEEAGRRARYAFFRQAAHQFECDLVATAHTKSDHAETVLLNLTRGSGLSGLAGIPERREGIIRPLLPFSRAETRAYCESRGLWFHDDPANSDVEFSRVRIRHRVLPELSIVNPEAEEAIARLAGLVAEEDRFMNGMAAAALERAEVLLNGPLRFLTEDVEVCFRRDALADLPPVLFRRAARLAVETLGGSLDHNQTRIVRDGIAASSIGSVTAVGGDVVVEWTAAQLLVRRLNPTIPFRHVLTVPGETISDEFGWRFVAFPDQGHRVTEKRASLDVHVADAVGGLYFRTVAPGDKMQPLGFDGHRKLSDLLAESGLTAAARARLPIVCDMVGPLWIPGICLDERSKPRDGSQRITRIRFERLLEPPAKPSPAG